MENKRINKIRDLLREQDYPTLLEEMGVDEKIMTNPAWKSLLQGAVTELKKHPSYANITVENGGVYLSSKFGANNEQYFSVTDGAITATSYTYDETKSPYIKRVDTTRIHADKSDGDVISSVTRTWISPLDESKKPAGIPMSVSACTNSFSESLYNSDGIELSSGNYLIESFAPEVFQRVNGNTAIQHQRFTEDWFRLTPEKHSKHAGIITDGLQHGQERVRVAQVAYRTPEDLPKINILEAGMESRGRSGRFFCQLGSEHGLATIDPGLFTYGGIGWKTYTEGEYASFIEDSKQRYDIVSDERERLKYTATPIAEAVMSSVEKTYGKDEGYGQK